MGSSGRLLATSVKPFIKGSPSAKSSENKIAQELDVKGLHDAKYLPSSVAKNGIST